MRDVSPLNKVVGGKRWTRDGLADPILRLLAGGDVGIISGQAFFHSRFFFYKVRVTTLTMEFAEPMY